jgi:CRISPR-associated protein Cmr1
MKTETFHLEFITPCFCGGADPSHAELRASSIRGQMRWWFRALGGTPEEEREAFGGVHANSPSASSFAVRVRTEPGTGEKDWHSDRKIPRQGIGSKTYLLGFFCGRTNRLQPSGALAPGSKATVTLTFRRPPPHKLGRAIRTFFSIGALGFRSTRAAGAFWCRDLPLTANSIQDLSKDLEAAGFTVSLLPDVFGHADWVPLCERAGSLLKNKLRGETGISAGRGGTSPNALGSAAPRQASAVHLRPVRVDGMLRLLLLEAPHARILGPDARLAHRNRGPVLKLANLAS